MSEDGSVQVAKIYKQWRGLCAEAFTDTDNFGISFPMDMDVRAKALLLGALFLIVSLNIFNSDTLLFDSYLAPHGTVIALSCLLLWPFIAATVRK